MNILILAKSIDGGTGTFIGKLLTIKQLRGKQPLNIRVLALEAPGFRRPVYRASFVHPPAHYPQTYGLTLKSVISFIREWMTVVRTVTEFNPHIILSIDLHSNILAILIKKLIRREVKVIASTHIQLSETLRAKASPFVRRMLTFMIGALYKYADSLVAVSEGIRGDLITHFRIKNKINLIHNGVLPAKTTKTTGLSTGRTVLSIGRLVPQKDFPTLIRAFSLLHKDMPEAKLVIVGDGSQKEELKQLVRREGLGKYVCFQGWRQDCSLFYRSASLFVLSSLREGFPYVLLEAMGSGLPVVSTDTPYGPREILGRNAYGVIVPMQDINTLATAMRELLTNPKKHKKYSEKAYERANYYSVSRMLKKYQVLLDSL